MLFEQQSWTKVVEWRERRSLSGGCYGKAIS